jgi:hypothetical protein
LRTSRRRDGLDLDHEIRAHTVSRLRPASLGRDFFLAGCACRPRNSTQYPDAARGAPRFSAALMVVALWNLTLKILGAAFWPVRDQGKLLEIIASGDG